MVRHVGGAGSIERLGTRRVLAVGVVAAVLAFVALPASEASGATGAEHPVSDPVMQTSTVAFGQRHVAGVFDGNRWFAVWAENRSGGFDIMGARVGVDGSLPDGDGITISTGVDNGFNTGLDAFNPAVAVDDNGQFLVAWTDEAPGNNDVYAARVSAAGRVLDPAAIAIDADADNDLGPSIAWNGSTFFVAYEHSVSAGQTVIHGALVTSAGAVQSLGPIAPVGMASPSVGVSGSTFLLVGIGGGAGVSGRRFAGNGTALEAQPFVIANLATQTIQPTVAGGPDGWLAVWTDKRNGDSNLDVFGARITPAGTVADPNGFQVSGASGNQDLPKIGVVGSTALVMWRDLRDVEQDVFGAHVSLSTGTVHEPNGFAVAASAEGETAEAVAAGPGSNHAAFLTRFAAEAPYGGAQRAFVRQISPK